MQIRQQCDMANIIDLTFLMRIKTFFRNYPADARSAFRTELFTVLDESLVV